MIAPARRRRPELMDEPGVDAAELARSLRDLEGVNRWLGGTRVVVRALEPLVAGGGETRLLDVATGSADIPLALAAWARARALPLRVVASDGHPATVALARQRAADHPDVSVELADALRLPYADGSFDVAMCNTAIHHFDRADAVRVMRELRRVARRGVVVTDLTRSWTGIAGVRLLAETVWRRHPVTRHDGPVSLRAAYRPGELREMAMEAGLKEVRVRSWLLYARMSMVGQP